VNATDEDGPSKSQRKREAAALQSLGEELAALPAEALDRLELPDRLRLALEELQNISSHEARRRQRQFIGRLMREVDPAPLHAFIEARKRPSRDAARLFRLAEHWRDRLLDEGEPAVLAFAAAFPAADAQGLGETTAAARQGRSGAPRRLFRMVRAAIDASGAAGGPEQGPPAPPALLE